MKPENETDEEFKKRIAGMMEAEVKEEFQEEYQKLMRKYECTHAIETNLSVAKLDFPK